MDNKKSQSLSLKILVAVEKNEVVFAESDHDFVDVLFSWMTIPVGEIVKLIGDQSLGCMSNLYASVKKFDRKSLRSALFKEVLLHPRSAAEIYCRKLKVNLCERDNRCDFVENSYYECKDCSLVTYYPNEGAWCRCTAHLAYEIELPSLSPRFEHKGSFTKATTHFMISNDLQVRPISTGTTKTLLQLQGDMGMLEERTLSVGKDKILELLKFSLVSKTPLTKAFLDSVPLNKRSRTFRNLNNGPGNVDHYEETISSSVMTENTISLKLIINSINNTVLYAEAANDFVDLLFSFLTFPIGYLFEKNLHFPFNGCMNNVYQSINDIKVELFESAGMKKALLKSKLAPGLAQHKKIVSIQDATKPEITYLSKNYNYKRSDCYNRYVYREATIADGFIKGPSSFMIMDNLEVMHLSLISGLSLIKKMQIPFGKIVEKEVVMGEKEAIRLFTASLVAENALTDTFLRDEMKQ